MITPKHSTAGGDCRPASPTALPNVASSIIASSIAERKNRTWLGMCAAVAFAMLICFGVQNAPPASAADGPTTQRSSARPSRALPIKLEISPNGVTLAASQSQHFKVTDAAGKSVAVHWDVSGISCLGSACGTVDDDGTYHAPPSLSRAIVVVLEGVLASDPKHSVLTRIHVAPADAPQVIAQAAAQAPVQRPAVVDVPPPHGPLVSYQGGQLTIDAVNTTLAAVLEKIAEKTGAVIAVPPGTGLEPVVMHAGPGPANDVLTHLLNGSSFNFVIVDSPQYPDEPVQVVLSEKREGNAPIVPSTLAVAPPAPAEPPPDPDAFVPVVVPPQVSAKAPPAEQLSPDAIEQMMKDRARQIRENAQQQQ